MYGYFFCQPYENKLMSNRIVSEYQHITYGHLEALVDTEEEVIEETGWQV
jgi:hypothetical protein